MEGQMNLSYSLTQILDALEPAFAKLSEVFNVSTTAIQQHGMEYILMYGKYEVTMACIYHLIVAFIFSTLCAMLAIGLWFDSLNKTSFEIEKSRVSAKRKVVALVILFELIILGITFVSTVAPYIISPEIYSIKAVIELVNPNVQM